MTQTSEIVAFLDSHLRTESIDDYSCNGLQVQGPVAVTTIGLAVDACMDAYRAAVREKCELLIVHHGLIWGGLRSITGSVHGQVSYLLDHGLGLYASHLPLDLHPVDGNNVRLCAILGIAAPVPFGKYHGIDIGYAGNLPMSLSIEELSQKLDTALGGASTALPFGKTQIRSVGIVSGGGSDTLDEAIAKNLDCLITGESQHQNHHLALEGSINVLYAGHYYTEKPGVQALGKLLERTFGVRSVFLDIPTLV